MIQDKANLPAFNTNSKIVSVASAVYYLNTKNKVIPEQIKKAGKGVSTD